MLNVNVCIGSSCHLKGAPKVIELFKQAIAENHLEDRVNLGASFCLGHCAEGVSVKIGEEIVTGVGVDNFETIFQKYVLEALA